MSKCDLFDFIFSDLYLMPLKRHARGTEQKRKSEAETDVNLFAVRNYSLCVCVCV